jgi:hypothetical protein
VDSQVAPTDILFPAQHHSFANTHYMPAARLCNKDIASWVQLRPFHLAADRLERARQVVVIKWMRRLPEFDQRG